MPSATGGGSLCVQCFDPCPEGGVCHNCGALERPGVALPLGTLLKNGDYRLGKVLGSGGVGITYLAWDKVEARKVAIKEFYPRDFVWREPERHTVTLISKTDNDDYQLSLDRFTKEATQLKSLRLPNGTRHRNIVEYFEFFSGENGTAYIVMEYVGDSTFENYLESEWSQHAKTPSNEVVAVMDSVLDALAFVHQHNLLHLDVSPNNICITPSKTVKLIDFGSAKIYIGNIPTHTQVKKVTPGFSPPELYGKSGYTAASDVYSAAATLYYALSGIVPPESTDRVNGGADQLLPLSATLQVPDYAATAIMKALSLNQANRFQSIREFQKALEPPLIKPPDPSAVKKTPLNTARLDVFGQQKQQQATTLDVFGQQKQQQATTSPSAPQTQSPPKPPAQVPPLVIPLASSRPSPVAVAPPIAPPPVAAPPMPPSPQPLTPAPGPSQAPAPRQVPPVERWTPGLVFLVAALAASFVLACVLAYIYYQWPIRQIYISLAAVAIVTAIGIVLWRGRIST